VSKCDYVGVITLHLAFLSYSIQLATVSFLASVLSWYLEADYFMAQDKILSWVVYKGGGRDVTQATNLIATLMNALLLLLPRLVEKRSFSALLCGKGTKATCPIDARAA
jgi:hypothetical protein